MERIQQAIEKARRDRKSRTESPSDDLGVDTAKNQNQQSTTRDNDSNKSRSLRVNYSKTRSVFLDAQTLKDLRIIAGFSHDKRSESYRQLRGQLLNKFRENNWQTLAITSPNSGAGKTLTALNLAISLSMEVNQTVLLVDMDLHQPKVATCLGIDDIEYGIMDYVNGKKELEDILIHPGFERLVLLPGTPQEGFSSEMLTSPEMKEVTKEIIDRYPSRIIIFDLPAVLSHDDALVFAPTCDASLMIIDEGGTTKDEVERSYQLLDGANIIGSVLNKVKYK